MTDKDPLYGHRVGSFPCVVPKCQGHKAAYLSSIHRLYEQKPKNKIKETERRLSESVGRKIKLGGAMGKAKKLAAKELGVKCFNAMTSTELDEAINLATELKSTPLGGNQDEHKIDRLEAIQAAARERTKARFAAIKAKKEQQK